jgi:hypothetical protein
MATYNTQVINLVLDAMVAHITQGMQTAINPDMLSYVDVVKKGLLQTDKTSKNVQIGITGGDHDDPLYKDAIVSENQMQDVGIYFPAREVGGGQLWWRRGIARVECFFIRERLTEDEAFQAGYEVLGRLESLIETTPISNIVDDYGERAIMMFCYANTFFESGGPPKNYIFRGKVSWTCLTERS